MIDSNIATENVPKASIMLNLFHGCDYNLACLLRSPDARWNQNYDQSNIEDVFTCFFRNYILERVRYLCCHQIESHPLGTYGTYPISDAQKNQLTELAEKLHSEPLWWWNWFKHVDSGFIGLERHRPEYETEIKELKDFVHHLNVVMSNFSF